jgi:hypothetical protein
VSEAVEHVAQLERSRLVGHVEQDGIGEYRIIRVELGRLRRYDTRCEHECDQDG